jgi:beta-galactosidase
MGRFWNIGPQKTLYVPGPWLRKGPNEIVVFDVNGAPDHTVEGLTKPNFGPTGPSGPQ